ncbi:uncharacterized protein METZ01_LOCUS74346 [marine metagenome]|uniref:Uncharacterized protein n=1 Tax=marine metagenome TaxID=408172 RepID=A0A381TZS6_9ZZZZ
MRKIFLRLISAWAAWKNYKDEVFFSAFFCQPNDLLVMACPLVNHLHFTIGLIELDTGIQIFHMQC